MLYHQIYERLKAFLEPSQDVVTLILWGVIGVALLAIFFMDPVQRTAATLWFILP